MESKHFKTKELSCHHCGANRVTQELLVLLESIREKLGEPIFLTSAYRCEVHNKKCGGKPKSQHLLGKAADIHIKSKSPKQLAAFLEKNFKIGGMGIYPTFVHVDVRKFSSKPIRW
jgi:uncharacterized protein YcbK (DUF882 family)